LALSYNGLTGPLPLTIGLVKARGCKVYIDGGFELSRNTSTVLHAEELDFNRLGLVGRCHD